MFHLIGVARLIEELRKRPGDAADFFEQFGTFVRLTLDGKPPIGAYRGWIERRIAKRGMYQCGTNPDHFIRRDAELVRDIASRGILTPIETRADANGLEIHGWHRLVIAHALGHETILAHRRENHPGLKGASQRAPLTLLMAHPDDEIFLWPFLPHATRIIAMASDEANAARPAWSRRLEAFRAVCEHLGVQSKCLGLPSSWYRAPRAGLEGIAKQLAEALAGEVVATHNTWGEYGHVDHILCHRVAVEVAPIVLATSIRLQRDWLPIGQHAPPNPHRLSLGPFQRDKALFATVRAIYAERIPWPDDIPVADECEVYVC